MLESIYALFPEPGPKPSTMPAGQLQPWRFQKIAFVHLVTMMNFIMAQVTLGIPITLVVVECICLGVLTEIGSTWVPSRSWYRLFVRDHGHLSWKAGTATARKLPPGWEATMLAFRQRFTYIVDKFKIPKQLCFNMVRNFHILSRFAFSCPLACHDFTCTLALPLYIPLYILSG